MSDTALPVIFRFDTTANRLAFTPTPGVAEQLYIWEDSDDQPNAYYWDGANWQLLNGGSSGGNVNAGGTLTSNALVIGQGSTDVAVTTTGTGILTALGINIGSAGAPVVFNGALGTPASGDATNLTNIPVANALSGSILPGVNGGGVVRLSQIVTSSTQATVDFTSIPASYNSLMVTWTAKDTTSGNASSNMRLKINNDGTSGNYTVSGASGSSNGTTFASSDAASANGGIVGNITNAGTTSQVGNGTLMIVAYANTTFFKGIYSTWNNFNTTGNIQVGLNSFSWKSTSAISRLTFTAATAFTDGSIFTLYGVN